mgnify:CR=1 FL=1
MNRTIEDSKQFDVVCMSFGKERERGIEVESSGEKDSLFETMERKAGNCTVKDMNFSKEQLETLKAYRKARKTVKSLRRKENQRLVNHQNHIKRQHS